MQVGTSGVGVPIGGLVSVDQSSQLVAGIDELLVVGVVVIARGNLPCAVTGQLSFGWIGHHIGDERRILVGLKQLRRGWLHIPHHAEQ